MDHLMTCSVITFAAILLKTIIKLMSKTNDFPFVVMVTSLAIVCLKNMSSIGLY